MDDEEPTGDPNTLLKALVSDPTWAARRRASMEAHDLVGFPFHEYRLAYMEFGGESLRGVNFRGRDLMCTRFVGTDLSGAFLDHADLRQASFFSANLRMARFNGADLRGAVFSGCFLNLASFRGANLRGAVFKDTSLSHVDFKTAKVAGVKWPSPSSVLLASWGHLPPGLVAKAMAFDAAHHPEPDRFEVWAKRGDSACPYHGAKVGRACNFIEARQFWDSGVVAPSALELMRALLEECCDTSEEVL